MFLINCNAIETDDDDDDDRYVTDDDDGIFLTLLFFLYFICLNFAYFFYSLPFCLAFPFSTLPFMMRVRSSNACKDCLVCIAGGHYGQGRDSECKLNYTPDIRSMWGYIVFAFPFVRSSVRSFVH